jgi:hypothetical protein
MEIIRPLVNKDSFLIIYSMYQQSNETNVLFYIRFFCVLLSTWNLGSFVMREFFFHFWKISLSHRLIFLFHCQIGMFLTGRPMAVLFSFRSMIESVTTYPFIFSVFMEHGQYLYGMLKIIKKNDESSISN